MGPGETCGREGRGAVGAGAVGSSEAHWCRLHTYEGGGEEEEGPRRAEQTTTPRSVGEYTRVPAGFGVTCWSQEAAASSAHE